MSFLDMEIAVAYKNYSSEFERLYSRIRMHDSGACWEWTGSLKPSGYGQLRVGGKTVYAHRMAYELANGPVPDGKEVMHKCDNRRCCNPNHLVAGSRSDNMQDCWGKKRGFKPPPQRGTDQHLSKLTPSAARHIYASSLPHSDLAREYGVTISAVASVRSGETWREWTRDLEQPKYRDGRLKRVG